MSLSCPHFLGQNQTSLVGETLSLVAEKYNGMVRCRCESDVIFANGGRILDIVLF